MGTKDLFVHSKDIPVKKDSPIFHDDVRLEEFINPSRESYASSTRVEYVTKEYAVKHLLPNDVSVEKLIELHEQIDIIEMNMAIKIRLAYNEADLIIKQANATAQKIIDGCIDAEVVRLRKQLKEANQKLNRNNWMKGKK